ncbi:MAG: hypothetical protein FWD31_03785 [Planctomycetaceae bacterium]|nr:hypothetical protein [Planctomycetaceae bacterium]
MIEFIKKSDVHDGGVIWYDIPENTYRRTTDDTGEGRFNYASLKIGGAVTGDITEEFILAVADHIRSKTSEKPQKQGKKPNE